MTGLQLVLIGGGHAHAIVVEQLRKRPLAGVRVTLISDTTHAPYSGMLPGHVAGFYNFETCHIPLEPLCQKAGVEFYCDRAIGLDLENQRVLCEQRPPVAFDWLSIDVGSTPAKTTVVGAAANAIAAKPVPQFLAAWNQFLEQMPQTRQSIGIVGGGAGGVELALNMRGRFHQLGVASQIAIHLFHRSDRLTPQHNRYASQTLEKLLHQNGIQLHLEAEVKAVTPTQVICQSGLSVECHPVFWVTQASAPDWIQASGLATDERGFIAINSNLQSLSHPRVFAAGDVATLVDDPRPKAGVFAVRQGKPLGNNLQRALSGQPLQPYSPQKRFLGLIGTGDKRAIASWGPLGCGPYAGLWQWKDFLDRQFMARFRC